MKSPEAVSGSKESVNQSSRSTVEVGKWYLTWKNLLISSIVLRLCFLLWGQYQDANMEPRFTDIDYMVFTDASRFVSQGKSPYERDTYRYTPLLSWLLLPTAYGWFSFGKWLFGVGDVVAGWFIMRVLRLRGVSESRAVVYTCLWLLNPMVCAISARGSSEGLLCAMVAAFVWAVCARRIALAGVFAGLAVHFKIYPIIYVPTVLWVLNDGPSIFGSTTALGRSSLGKFFNVDRIKFGIYSATTFTILTGIMYYVYGYPFLHHSYLHHLSRIDHRHNFSPYSTLLYMAWSPVVERPVSAFMRPESWAFMPQLTLSAILIPLVIARRDIVKAFFIQTFAFVTFNKVCTSQYFMWYIVFLPFYGPSIEQSSATERKVMAIGVVLWALAQALWLRYAYLLEFLGLSVFYPQLFISTLIFFTVNCWALGRMI
uniref:GPI mannosyltransferase 1 n=1 Tax=Blastobotrys adeninivorans TaxID=409370 RepID=A0A060T3S1_BLAAD